MEALEGRQMFAFGQLDSAFGSGGSATAPGTTGAVTDLDILNNNQILASGSGGIVRYNANGSVDSTFASNGRRAIASGATFRATAVDRSTGKIYALVSAEAGTILLRYTAQGALDSGFATNGTALVSADEAFTPAAMAVQADGKVLVAGAASTDNGHGATARVYRLRSNGSIDTSFGAGGSRNVTLGATNLLTPQTLDRVGNIEVGANGNILIGGHSSAYARQANGSSRSYGDSFLAAARLTSSGNLDTSFGAGGVARTTYLSGREPASHPPMFALKRDGTCLVAASDGASTRWPYDPAGTVVAKFDAAGTTTFLTRTTGTEFGVARAMVPRSDGRVILVGRSPNADDARLQMVTLNAQGAIGNVVYADDLDATTNELKSDVAAIAQPVDGDIIVGGAAARAGGYLLMKFDAGPTSATRPDDFAGGSANDLVRDANGGLHLAYFDAVARVLKYAYRARNGLWNAPITVDAAPEAGQYVSIDVDSTGRVGIAYFEGNHGDLKYAQQTAAGGSRFAIETVEGPGITGLYPSFDFDDSNRPSIAYYRKTSGDLKFVKKNAGVWNFEVVDTTNDVGRCAQLVPQPVSRRYSIAYTDTTTGDVKLASRAANGRWELEVAAATSGAADFVSLAYAPSNAPSGFSDRPAVTFFDANPADLKIAQNNAVGDTWTVTTLATRGAVGMYGSMNFHSGSGASVYYYNRTNNSLALLHNDFVNGVRAETIVSGGGRNLSVFSSANRVDIAYVDDASGALRVRSAPRSRESSPSSDNTLGTARDIGNLTGSVLYNDSVGVSDSADFYKFTLDAPATFRLTMDGMSTDADVQLLDANGQVIIGSYAGSSSSELIDRALDAGQYYVRVFPYSGSTSYRLTLNATPR
jgi:uncharacterized delta-60 repeat protein